jgi:hypothetical protein
LPKMGRRYKVYPAETSSFLPVFLRVALARRATGVSRKDATPALPGSHPLFRARHSSLATRHCL